MEMHKVSMEDINVDTLDCTRSYPRLVRSRKECRLCESLGLTNPALVESGIYDSEDVGPWSRWHGEFNPDL